MIYDLYVNGELYQDKFGHRVAVSAAYIDKPTFTHAVRVYYGLSPEDVVAFKETVS